VIFCKYKNINDFDRYLDEYINLKLKKIEVFVWYDYEGLKIMIFCFN